MNLRRLLVPSVGVAIWLAIFLGQTLSDWRQVLISADGDACLHRRIGEWMLEQRAVLRVEQFSHTRFGAPVIAKEWLGEIAYAGMERALGWNGAVLLAALLIATTLWLLHRQLLAEGCELLLATGLVLLAALASSHHWLARPHLVTHLFALLFAWQLRAFDRAHEPRAARLFLVLVPAMWLWANLHGAFFTGFVLIGVYAAGNLARPGKAMTFTALGAACLLASLANPNGWHLHAHIVAFLREPVIAKFANEFRSPNFHSGAMRGFLLELLVLGLLLLVARPRWRATDLLLVVVWGYFALQAVRNIPIFAIVVTPMLAEHWNRWLREARVTGWLKHYRRISGNVTGLDRAAGGGALVAACVAGIVIAESRGVIATDVLPERFPVAAVQWLREQPDAVRGEMFNDYAWGGYLMFVLPERRVFVDGRNDFYGPALIEEFNKVDDVEPGWDEVLHKYNVHWTILPAAHRLNQVLALAPGWKEAYRDSAAVIYTR